MRRTRFLSLVMAASLAASSFVFIPSSKVYADEINISTQFPDVKVQDWALEKVDTDGNGKLSDTEISNVKDIYMYNRSISDLSGIEIFTNLKSLFCSNNNLTSLNVSYFKNLETLTCESNQLTSITFGDNNIKLKEIDCIDNQLTTLTTSKLKSLQSLKCSKNKISSLNMTNNVELQRLECDHNNLSGKVSSLKIQNCANLNRLNIGYNNFTNLDLKNLPKLTYLNCDKNKFTVFNVNNLTSLTTLLCGYNDLSSLDISKLTELKMLDCRQNNFTTLDVSNNTKLWSLYCLYNKLETLDLSKNTELKTVYLAFGTIKSLDVSALTKLDYLDFRYNELSSINLSKNIELTNLDCRGNHFTSLDLSNNVNLKDLDCSENPLASLGIDKNINLESIDCEKTELTSLDISKFSKLKSLECNNNSMTSLIFGENPNLTRIKCQDNKLSSLKVPSTVTKLLCYHNSISELDISKNELLLKLTSTTDPSKVAEGIEYKETFDNQNLDLVIDDGTKFITPTPTPTQVPTPSPSEESSAQILAFVNRLYQYVLGRDPETEGAQYWTNELYSFRKTGAEVAQGFIFSKEFIDKNTSNKDFVTILYKTFFGRDPETEGFNYWVGQLDSGSMSRERVANGFIFSQEWADKCAEYGIRSGGDIKPSGDIKPTSLTYGFVERMYNKALGRDYDTEGRAYWASQLANYNLTGEQLGVQFFLSDEMNKKGLSNEEFVNRLYLTFMDREGETDGVNYWVGQLNGGASRSSVVYGFTRSAEFVEKCINARIIPN